MKTTEPLDADKMLQMLVDSKSDMPCIAMHGSHFCEDCNVGLLDYPKKGMLAALSGRGVEA